MKRMLTRLSGGIGAALVTLAGFGIAQADTVISTTQYSYNYSNQVVCTAVRMNMAITQPTDPCTPATTVGAGGPDRITQNVYDAAGQLLAVYRGVGTSSIIQYAYYNYTNNGLKSFEIDANHNKTTFTYDGFDRLSKIQYPNTTVGNETSSTTDYEQFAYDNNGNKTWWKRRNGVYIYYNYDNLNREVLSYPGDSSIPNLYTGYDGLGRILWKRSGNTTPSTPGVTYAYDGLGRVAATTDFNNRTINYQYNAASGRTKLIFPDGAYVQYTLDNLNRVSTAGLNGTANVLFGQVFDSLGRRTSLTRGISSVGGATTYGYDNLGRIISFANDLSGTAYDIAWTFSAYNAANQITTWGASSVRYDYVETATTTTAKTYDGLNRDATIAAISGGYDTNGNLAKDGARTMAYDVYNRLLTATGTGTYAGLNLKLVYDTEGRLAKYSTDGGTTYTTFLYDGTNLIGEYNNAGSLTERYIHGTGTDEPIVWYRGAGVTATDQKFLYQNYQGSVIAYTDSAGVMTYYYKYDPYGVPVTAGNTARWPSSPASYGPRFSYTGQIALPEAGLYYYKARVYDPAFGRFLQTDPVGSRNDLDLYAYTGGDPVNMIDPSGLTACPKDDKNCVDDPNSEHDKDNCPAGGCPVTPKQDAITEVVVKGHKKKKFGNDTINWSLPFPKEQVWRIDGPNITSVQPHSIPAKDCQGNDVAKNGITSSDLAGADAIAHTHPNAEMDTPGPVDNNAPSRLGISNYGITPSGIWVVEGTAVGFRARLVSGSWGDSSRSDVQSVVAGYNNNGGTSDPSSSQQCH